MLLHVYAMCGEWERERLQNVNFCLGQGYISVLALFQFFGGLPKTRAIGLGRKVGVKRNTETEGIYWTWNSVRGSTWSEVRGADPIRISSPRQRLYHVYPQPKQWRQSQEQELVTYTLGSRESRAPAGTQGAGVLIPAPPLSSCERMSSAFLGLFFENDMGPDLPWGPA